MKSRGLKSLADSREELVKAIDLEDLPSKYEAVWLAYCSAELGIGILKLGRDESGKGTGSFRKIRRTGKTGLTKNGARERIDSELRNADSELRESILCFQVGVQTEEVGEASRFEAGLEHARKARDTLKLVLLESKNV